MICPSAVSLLGKGTAFEEIVIKDKELKLVKPVKRGKRMFHLGDVVNGVEHPGGGKPFPAGFGKPLSGCGTVPMRKRTPAFLPIMR